MIFTTTYFERTYTLNTSTITFVHFKYSRPVSPQFFITASPTDALTDEVMCTYNSGIVQSCPELLTYVNTNYPEYFI